MGKCGHWRTERIYKAAYGRPLVFSLVGLLLSHGDNKGFESPRERQ
jgi:hypothetical protein